MTTHLLRAGGVGVLVDAAGPALPRVLHWGADPGDLDAAALDRLAADLQPSLALSGFDEPWPL
ncbi:MAG TPA: hypothetical protein VE781_09215, partial [Kineosporiaceae bacterium]|nr:hypothetical protein [Kineosporiaceae bacterium]